MNRNKTPWCFRMTTAMAYPFRFLLRATRRARSMMSCSVESCSIALIFACFTSRAGSTTVILVFSMHADSTTLLPVYTDLRLDGSTDLLDDLIDSAISYFVELSYPLVVLGHPHDDPATDAVVGEWIVQRHDVTPERSDADP